MKLGLLGYPVNHSLSPALYKQFLGPRLTSYELFSCPTSQDVPKLKWFAEKLDGLNITSPYKTHFINEIKVPSQLVKELGAVNTLAFVNGEVFGTNTDLVAIVEILTKYKQTFPRMQLLLLGDGVMARVTKLVSEDLKIPLKQFSRKLTPGFTDLDLSQFAEPGRQNIIINSCSRDYVFQGNVWGAEIFWDYNYSFLPHQNTLPSRVMTYVDGREMLELQAKAAIKFWEELNPKLK